MSFLLRKKNFRFEVNLEAEELTAVPFVSGVLFAKIRLVDGGQKAVWTTPREEVVNHVVQWKTRLQFPVKLSASILGGVLEKCICRVSIRKEIKGGKSFQKLGFVDVNLSEFAGTGFSSQRFLLEGYDSKKRLDNSLLKVNICMTLLSGDPCFKAPRSVRMTQNSADESSEDVELHAGNKGGDCDCDYNSDSLTSRSSGFESLPKGEPLDASLRSSELEKHLAVAASKALYDASSLPSKKSQSVVDCSAPNGFQRSFSVSYKVTVDNYSRHFSSSVHQRHHKLEMDSTPFRNTEQLVEEILQESNCRPDEKLKPPEDVQLQLFVTNDGRALIGSVSPVHSPSPGLDCQT